MYRIRFHGRGGQGMKTASRMLGTAFFLDGFQVQDAPRYGAERRGAPMFAYVRADRDAIHERGIIRRPDLVVVADDTLVPIPAAAVLEGIVDRCVLLLNSATSAADWQHRLRLPGALLTLAHGAPGADPLEQRYVGASCAGAAARLVGVVSRAALEQAVRLEIGALGDEAVARNLRAAGDAYDAMAAHEGIVAQGSEPGPGDYQAPDWMDVPFDDARFSAPAIHGALTSVQVRTGLWRTMRPVIDYDDCRRCWWVCSSLCPDGAIALGDGDYPEIDYEHCKGCMICVAQCPPHAIRTVPELEACASEGARP